MTRDELIEIIDESGKAWSCPEKGCDKPEKEGNTGECCCKCAEEQLARYENKIINEAIKNKKEEKMTFTELAESIQKTTNLQCILFVLEAAVFVFEIIIYIKLREKAKR